MTRIFVASLATLMTCMAIPATAMSDDKKPLYKVVDGYKVDSDTMDGFRAWRSAACDRCHGPNQEGMVGPSLIERLKVLTPEEFKTTVLNGRLQKGMPSFGSNQKVVENIDNLYAYLKGRSDGAITKAKVQEIKE
jgi:mono/diheme cytochrome c family protein